MKDRNIVRVFIAAASSADEIAGQVTSPMNTLVSVILSVLAVVGVLMLVKAISELSNAIQDRDNSGIFHAGRGIVSALLMISLKLIIRLFGYEF